MPGKPVLYGYDASTYTRMARLALAEKEVAHEYVRVASWDGYRKDPDFAGLHPFAKVPVFDYGDMRIYETLAICTFLDQGFEGPALQPLDPVERARMIQRISVVVNYAWPVWVPLFAGVRFFSAFEGRPPDTARLAEAMPRIEHAAGVIDGLLAERPRAVLDLSDIYLAGSFCYLAEAAEGEKLRAANPNLASWWQAMRKRPSVADILPPTDWAMRLNESEARPS